MEHAQELLKNPDLLIKDIASMVGYNTIQSFTRYFKKYYHVTPEQWKKNCSYMRHVWIQTSIYFLS